MQPPADLAQVEITVAFLITLKQSSICERKCSCHFVGSSCIDGILTKAWKDYSADQPGTALAHSDLDLGINMISHHLDEKS